jgi:hypothetical protein
METLQKQTSLFTEDNAILSQEDSRVNHTAKRESGSEKRMNAIYGPKCLEQLEKFSRVGLWAKTFSALLIGREDWYSTKCKLTWKLRGTKFSRMYFQLVPSTLRTEGIGFGLLPTTNTTGIDGGSNSRKANKKRIELLKTPGAMDAQMENMTSKSVSGTSGNLAQEAKNGYLLARLYRMIPTPTAMDATSATATMKSTQVKEGSMHSVTLSRWVNLLPTPTASDKTDDMNSASQLNGDTISGALQRMMLPTPKAGDWKDTGSVEMLCNLRETSGQFAIVREIAHIMNDQGHGKDSLKLNPQFVGEMMGFPPNWTESPFLSGETNQSKPSGTP